MVGTRFDSMGRVEGVDELTSQIYFRIGGVHSGMTG